MHFLNLLLDYLHLYITQFIINFLKIGLNEFINQTLVKIILPIIIQVLLISFFYDYLPFEKSKFNLTVVIGFGAFLSFAGFLTLYLTSKYYRIKYNYYFKKYLKHKLWKISLGSWITLNHPSIAEILSEWILIGCIDMEFSH